MANEKNLIPNSKRTPKELREITRKGGIASGKARRKKANLKKAFEAILEADVKSDKIKQQLENMGFEATNEMALAMVMMQKAMKGNVKAFEQIARLVATDTKDSLDRKEQRERIVSIQLGNEKLRAQIGKEEGQDEKIAGFLNLIKGAVSDGLE